MGKSASGKDTIYKALAADESLKLQTIVPYTTRPIRSGETQGVEYYFTEEKNYQKLKDDGRIIEARAYETIHGLWRYFTADDGQINVHDPHANYMVIGTLEAYRQMLARFGSDILIPVYVEVEDGLRLERALLRERAQEKPRYAEMCRRFLADCEDFSEDKIKECCIDKRYDNIDLSECLEQIRADIRLQIGQDCK